MLPWIKRTHQFIYVVWTRNSCYSCNWEILCKKLIVKNLPFSIINIISSLYRSGTTSYNFNLTQGVRQGSILSPHLYNIYTEKLLATFHTKLKTGTSIHGTYTWIIAYADDLILISSTLTGLQKMINYCVSYGIDTKIKFNTEKTEFLISRQHSSNQPYITLDNQRIKPNSTLKHLGFKWGITSQWNTAALHTSHTSEKLNNLWSIKNALINSGIRFCHPYTIAKLYSSIIIPRLTYGIEICKLSQTTLLNIDSQARSALKSLFNVSKFSKNILQQSLNLDDVSHPNT